MGEQKLTGYPSIDKPWLKYYSEETLNYPLRKSTVYWFLEDKVKDCLSKTAISYFGKRISYQTILDNIKRTAAELSALGVKAGDIVAVALPNIPENIYVIYALNYVGAIADMIDLRSKGDVLQNYLSNSHAKIAVICDLFAENTLEVLDKTEISTVIVASAYESMPFLIRAFAGKNRSKIKYSSHIIPWKAFVSGKHIIPKSFTDSDAVAFIAHTSGTTSTPKGVMLTNHNVNALINQYLSIGFEYDDSDIMLNQVPPFLAYWFLSVHLPFSMNMSVTLLPEYRPDKFAENLKKYKPNHVFAGPGDWGNVLENAHIRADYSNLKTLASGSDKLDETTKRKIEAVLQSEGCKNSILEGYGMTECCSAACTQLPWNLVYGSVGVPLPNNSVCIYDNESSTELSYGEIGEVCISGETLMAGYYGNIQATDEAIRIHSDGKRWLHSGDLGYIDENGNVFLAGRIKRIIVRYDGIKVSPTCVENVLLKHKAVSACCVVGAPDAEHGRGQMPVAYVVINVDDIIADLFGELSELCSTELSDKYIPSTFVKIDALPLTPNGKVDYRTLEREAEKLRN